MSRPCSTDRLAVLQITLLILLAFVTVRVHELYVFNRSGIDFYHFWGVSAANKLAEQSLGDPYLNAEHYADVLNSYANTTIGDSRLMAANQTRRNIDLTATPLLYLLFALFPLDYTLGLTLHRIACLLAFMTAVAVFWRLYEMEGIPYALGLMVFLLALIPLFVDLEVGNINCLLVLGLAIALGLGRRLQAQTTRRFPLGSVLLNFLVFLTMVKPVVALPCALLAYTVWQDVGTATMLRIVGSAVGTSLLLALLPCLYFRSWSVWWNWYMSIQGADARHLFYDVNTGNNSFALIASDWVPGGYSTVIVIVGALLIGLIGTMLAWSGGRIGLRLKAFGPDFMLALGIMFTFALSPLSWSHYYLLLLPSSLWLLSLPGWLLPIFGALTLFLSSGVFIWLKNMIEIVKQLEPLLHSLSWVPLLFGILVIVRRGKEGPGRGDLGY